jgi:hypothetical protein
VQKEVRAPRAFIFSGAVVSRDDDWIEEVLRSGSGGDERSIYVLTYIHTNLNVSNLRALPLHQRHMFTTCLYLPLSLASWVFVMHDGVGTLEMELVHLR